MFGGAGFYLDGEFFGILYKERLYFRVSADTIERLHEPQDEAVRAVRGQEGQSRGYYEVPLEILESPADLVTWAGAAQRTPPLTARKKVKREAPNAGVVNGSRSTREPSPTNRHFAQAIQPRTQGRGEEIDLFTVRAAGSQARRAGVRRVRWRDCERTSAHRQQMISAVRSAVRCPW